MIFPRPPIQLALDEVASYKSTFPNIEYQVEKGLELVQANNRCPAIFLEDETHSYVQPMRLEVLSEESILLTPLAYIHGVASFVTGDSVTDLQKILSEGFHSDHFPNALLTEPSAYSHGYDFAIKSEREETRFHRYWLAIWKQKLCDETTPGEKRWNTGKIKEPIAFSNSVYAAVAYAEPRDITVMICLQNNHTAKDIEKNYQFYHTLLKEHEVIILK
ncbi:MAG: hypothetical protein NDI94_03295 [Candidatus Woesearchaeota archaeon]|nr:hypothetical protein [Candidatus Woesearchaeota archaeon]